MTNDEPSYGMYKTYVGSDDDGLMHRINYQSKAWCRRDLARASSMFPRMDRVTTCLWCVAQRYYRD